MNYTSLLAFLIFSLSTIAQTNKAFPSLDKNHPIDFAGDHINYNGKKIILGPQAFYIDGQLPDSVTKKYPYVFNSVNNAAEKLTNGTKAKPMVLYIAPWVYWIDNPDDTMVRVPKDGSTPYGLVIKCEWLKLQGLTEDPKNVVLACNRGQTIGAKGNFTMFRFIGQGTGSENITFGNYCSVDLVFPLKPSLNRAKRASAIVQAQLIHCDGDKIVARNTRFISRLNLCPFVGGKRVLFDRCHFESTDDALCGTGVYLNCTLDFYSSKPFYRTTGTGAVFLNCAVSSLAGSQQYFTKADGQMAVIDTKFTSPSNTYLGWQDVPAAEAKNFQSNVTLNGKAILINAKKPSFTVDVSGLPLEKAYKFTSGGQVIYNTYNLLSGDDDWDPMGVKSLVLQSGFNNIPVQMLLNPSRISIETKKNEVLLKATLIRFGNYPAKAEKISWTVSSKDSLIVKLKPSTDGQSCTVIPVNQTDSSRAVIITAHTAAGLEAASLVNVSPEILPAPGFVASPSIAINTQGSLHINYSLDSKYADQSNITWYRCKDSSGSEPIEIAVSRFNKPLRQYILSEGDAGYFLMASISPKNIRSVNGNITKIIYGKRISSAEIKSDKKTLTTNFLDLSVRNQQKIIPGFWTFDYVPDKNIDPQNNTDPKRDAWYVGEGADGAANMIGLLQGRSGSASYTPIGNGFPVMKASVVVAPFKTAGQGFSVAHLYMDVLIKFDAKTKSGYGLRFIRTTKYGDAVDCMLVRYENGVVTNITEAVTTSAFRTLCTIEIEFRDNKLSAHVQTTGRVAKRPGVLTEVDLNAPVHLNDFGGFDIEYNGGSPTMIREVRLIY